MSKSRLEITPRILPDGKPFTAHCHALRAERGLSIETVTESHAGQFAGHHARYILRSPVEILNRNDREELARAA